MQSYILINCSPGHEKEIISRLKKIPEIVEINGVWGIYDIIVKVVALQPGEMDTVATKIRSTYNVTKTHTAPVLYGQGGSIDE